MDTRLWDIDTVTFDFEDRDATVVAIHMRTLTQVEIRFRVKEKQIKGEAHEFRNRLELMAIDAILDLASSLDK